LRKTTRDKLRSVEIKMEEKLSNI